MVSKGGIEFALTEFKNKLGIMRLSFMGIIELESNENGTPAFFDAEHNVALWRGHYGYGVSQTLDDLSPTLFDKPSQCELYIGWRHESDHFTGSEEGDHEPRFWQTPNIGDWFQFEEALRTPYKNIRNDIRLIQKYYIPVEGNRAYNFSLAMDFILEYKPYKKFHPYSSTYVEYLNGNEWEVAGIDAGVPDAKYFYQHFGVSIKGKYLRLKLYTLISSGNGKGKLMFEKSGQWGWGISVGIN